MKQTICKMCNEKDGEEVLNVSSCIDTYLDYMEIEYRSKNRFYKRCTNCSFVYRNLSLTSQEKERLYSCFRDFELRSESHRDYFKRISNYPKDESENHEKYKFLETFLGSSGRHMDIGGGLGVFSYGFKEYFSSWSSIVVEPTEGVDEIAIEHKVTSFSMYLSEESAAIVGNNFDLITANHVVEHVEDPTEFIILLKEFLIDGGMLYIEVPSAQDIGFLDKTHDRFMCQHEVIHDNKSVKIMAEKAGLEVLYNDKFLSKRGRNNVRAILKK